MSTSRAGLRTLVAVAVLAGGSLLTLPAAATAPPHQQVSRASSVAADHCRRTLASYPILHPGDRGRAVRTLQCALNDQSSGPTVVVDGWYGPQTRRAVHRITQGFEGSGEPHPYRINNGFWTLLYGRQLPSRVQRIGDQGHAVRVLQRALRAAGGDLVVDGRFGPQTRRVLRAFQREHDDRHPSGRCDREVVFLLGQGAVFGSLS
jgi:peptidoglycan hydrolase-like protein with peptidoglycan-binding domain